LVSFAALFLVVAFIDLERGLILNNVVLMGTLASFVLFPFGPSGKTHGIVQAYLWALAGGLTGFAARLVLYVSFPGGIGAVDVKLAGLIGTALGLQLLLTGLLLAFAAGSFVAVFLLASRLRTRKDALPFCPFLVGGALVAMVAGQQIQGWYLRLLL
jgi:leader peptidase (prepilin peptidase)/N-methyltransferase